MLPEVVSLRFQKLAENEILINFPAFSPVCWFELNQELEAILNYMESELSALISSEKFELSFLLNQKFLLLIIEVCTLRSNKSNFHVNDEFKESLMRLAKKIMALLRLRLFGRDNHEQSTLINIEEVDLMHMEGVYLLQIATFFPEIDLALVAGIG